MSESGQRTENAGPDDERADKPIARRRTELLEDGSYLFEDELAVAGTLSARVITCEAWLLELYDLRSGSVAFLSGKALVRPTSARFGVLVPPFSVSCLAFADTRSHIVGVAGTIALPRAYARGPVVFDIETVSPPASGADALGVLASGRAFQAVDAYPSPSRLSREAKMLLDRNYLDHPSIARIASRLGVTHEHLSRQFKRDYDLSPSEYLHKLRVADAPLRLARGEPIVEVSLSAGYNDLSRFYKQFRKSTRTSPGACRDAVKPPRRGE